MRVAPGRRQELGGLEQDGRAIVERPARPLLVRGERGVDRLLHERPASPCDSRPST